MTAVTAVEHVVLTGELDPVGAPSAGRQLAAALRSGAESIVVHLDEVTFIDSTGLRTLLAAADAADRTGVDLRILPGSLEIMAVVEAASLAGRLPFVRWP
ncbi:STAS domain-containing protein [Baekduia sp. Peel2402]|uniref:STAS domain-containing protein n=1 Tax=Baekduia sp. Peel2402 TaxID=3458296 RepID=UPI00403EA682